MANNNGLPAGWRYATAQERSEVWVPKVSALPCPDCVDGSTHRGWRRAPPVLVFCTWAKMFGLLYRCPRTRTHEPLITGLRDRPGESVIHQLGKFRGPRTVHEAELLERERERAALKEFKRLSPSGPSLPLKVGVSDVARQFPRRYGKGGRFIL